MEVDPEKQEIGLYEGVRGKAVKILNRIDRTDAYLEKLLETELKSSELSGKDKALLYEIVHGVIRHLGRIDWILTGFYKGQFSKGVPNIKNSLRVALYQIMFLDKVPDYAAVNESVDFIKKLQGQKPADLINAILRNIIRNKENIRYPDENEDLPGYLTAYHSHPSWMVKRWLNLYGREFTESLMEANNMKPAMSIRVNRLVSDIDEMKRLLNEVSLPFAQSPYFPEILRLKSLTNITDWEYFQKGYFTIQDESTAIPVELLDVKPGMKVLDLCAAPGGKTAFLADKMNNTGQITAIDKFGSRLKILEKNLKRLRIKNVELVESDAMDFYESGFDRVLLDAPCSGLGTLTKKPDIKWKRDLNDIRKLQEVQLRLLKKGASLLSSGGIIVYSTCTIDPSENNEVVMKFLESEKGFEVIRPSQQFSEMITKDGFIQTYPNIHKMDGAFSAIIKKV